MTREDVALTSALVGLVDTLVAGYDVVELTQQLVETAVDLLPVDAAGLLLVDTTGELRVFASTSEELRLLELLQIQSAAGPCLDAFRSGEQVLVRDITRASQWPTFGSRMLSYGFHGVCALPLHLRDERLGALNLFTESASTLAPGDLRIGQALADFATIGILHARMLADSVAVTEQLAAALNSRVVIEQAKGMIAERSGLDMNAAFLALRQYARDGNHRLAAIAAAVVDRSVALDAVLND
ncbi:GAF and ANTAR domain-containing protein [Nocardia jejuensis]|uniref:GAF and ANTAR domain-containing protein n=1 Tax=Nocardia jejuensis TaxID=328049 RepID=UPI00083551E3|nr:GAF and ANTAR domain-containing protein [Nocardia jejuensis]